MEMRRLLFFIEKRMRFGLRNFIDPYTPINKQIDRIENSFFQIAADVMTKFHIMDFNLHVEKFLDKLKAIIRFQSISVWFCVDYSKFPNGVSISSSSGAF